MQPAIIVFGLEDDIDDTFFIKEAFLKLGIQEYEFFSDPAEFFAVFNEDIHVAVVDFNLPGMNGQEVLDRILRINKSCRVVIISGNITNEMTVQLSLSGAKDCVVKQRGWEVKLAKIVKGHIEAAQNDIMEFNRVRNEIKSILRK